MQYAKIENNRIIPNISLPYSLLLSDGSLLCGFNCLSLEELKTYNYYELVNVTPSYDDRLSYLGEATYTIINDINNIATHIQEEYEIINYSITELKSKAITSTYQKCLSFLDKQSEGYSAVEISSFPIIQAEIVKYNLDGTIGDSMQHIINRGRHTASTLSSLLTPKILMQEEALLQRDNTINLIYNATTPEEVIAIDI